MAVYAREQAYCHFSPALIANLEKHWNAAQPEDLTTMPGMIVKGVDLTPRRETFEPIEIASRDEISALQLKRLKWTLEHVYKNVAHYRQAFDAAGVHPDDLKTLDDLRKFPFTTKAELREKYPFGLMAMPREQLQRVHASSGTTGKPTVVGYSRGDIETWAHLIARSLRAAGCRPGMLAQNSFGYGLFTGGLGFHHGAEKLGVTVVPVSGGMTERQVRLIGDFKPDVIFVTPSYLLAILDEFRAQGVDPRQSSLKLAICGAEPWTNAMREEIEEAFDLHAIDTYGLSEVIGPGVSSECIESKEGCTIWEDHFYPEVIDPATGAVLPRRRSRRTGVHLAHQGGDAGHSLSHPRSVPTAAGHRAQHAPHGKGDRAFRRHDDHPRRQRVSEPDRGDPAQGRAACRRILSSSCAATNGSTR